MARSTFTERMTRLEQQRARIAEEEARIKDQERKQRTRRLIEAGGLVEKAELLDLEANVLLGGLLALKEMSTRAGHHGALGCRRQQGVRRRGAGRRTPAASRLSSFSPARSRAR